MEYPLIAALYSDVDTRDPNAGNVWYRKTHERGVMDKIGERSLINSKCNSFLGRLSLPHGTTAELNTYQIVIASDERDSYVLLHYPENGIQWIKGRERLRGCRMQRHKSESYP
ncbi:Uncharacterized protein FKW44_013043, partial [Caligus rogercresseyi]